MTGDYAPGGRRPSERIIDPAENSQALAAIRLLRRRIWPLHRQPTTLKVWTDDAQFVDTLYVDALGRRAESTGLQD
jgi:hypothetical protein